MARANHQARLEREFAADGIDFAVPGFSESPEFLAAEANKPTLLLKYGDYVKTRHVDNAYAARARQRVRDVFDFFIPELAADGRLGACIDVSSVALKFLEREGIWGYVAVGSAVVEFINPAGRTQHLHHFMHPDNPARAGHAWLRVPPFEIVDLTIQAQNGFAPAERALLQPILAVEVGLGAAVVLEDLAEPELLALAQAGLGRPGRMDDFVSPTLRAYWRRCPALTVETQNARLKYVECGVMAGEGLGLEDMQNLTLSGRGPAALHGRFLEQFPAN